MASQPEYSRGQSRVAEPTPARAPSTPFRAACRAARVRVGTGTPPALRYVAFLGWRALMFQVYAAHKALVLWRECRPRALCVLCMRRAEAGAAVANAEREHVTWLEVHASDNNQRPWHGIQLLGAPAGMAIWN